MWKMKELKKRSGVCQERIVTSVLQVVSQQSRLSLECERTRRVGGESYTCAKSASTTTSEAYGTSVRAVLPASTGRFTNVLKLTSATGQPSRFQHGRFVGATPKPLLTVRCEHWTPRSALLQPPSV
jgi:hypothetical protein